MALPRNASIWSLVSSAGRVYSDKSFQNAALQVPTTLAMALRNIVRNFEHDLHLLSGPKNHQTIVDEVYAQIPMVTMNTFQHRIFVLHARTLVLIMDS